MDTKTRDVSKADEQGSQVTQYLVAFFLLAISLMAVCSSNDMVSHHPFYPSSNSFICIV